MPRRRVEEVAGFLRARGAELVDLSTRLSGADCAGERERLVAIAVELMNTASALEDPNFIAALSAPRGDAAGPRRPQRS